MRKYFVIVLLILLVDKSFSQSISIVFSIDWKEESVSCFEYESQRIPYLVITYQNNCNYPVYFLKLSNSNFGFPRIVIGGTAKMVDSSDDLNTLYDYSKYRYYVKFGENSYYNMNWDIISDSLKYEYVHEIDVINDVLADIYDYIIDKKYPTIKKDSLGLYDYPPDIKENEIMNEFKDNFIFLDANESYKDSFNLIGFNIIGGSYCFSANTDSLNNFVYSNPSWDENQEKWIYKMIFLPSKVGKYNLYSGEISPNDVCIKLSKTKSKE
jgi:hypothetical protein